MLKLKHLLQIFAMQQDCPKLVFSSVKLHFTCSCERQSYGSQQDGIRTHAMQLTAPMSLLHFDTVHFAGRVS